MDFFSVLETILEQQGALQFCGLLLTVALVYHRVFRRKVRSLLDPLTYVLVFSSFTVVLLFILVSLDIIAADKFIFSVATLALFYGTFLLTAGNSRKVHRRQTAGALDRMNPASLVILLLINSTLLAATYIFFGVPLFLESRLSLWTNAGGFGVIGRLTGGLEFVSLLIGVVAARGRGPQRRWGAALIVQFIIAAILSGSKGSLLSILFAWYLSEVRRRKTWNVSVALSRKSAAAVVVLLALPLLTIAIQTGRDGATGVSAVVSYATRVAAEGDGYVYFFGGDLIDKMARTDYLALVRPVLTGLRLSPVETAVNPGFEVMSQILSVDGVAAGPNSRLPIYILFFYGKPGIVLVPVLGLALGLARNAVIGAVNRSLYRYAVVASVYLACTKIEVDPQIFVNGLFNLGLALPVLWLARIGGEMAVPGASAGRQARRSGPCGPPGRAAG